MCYCVVQCCALLACRFVGLLSWGVGPIGEKRPFQAEIERERERGGSALNAPAEQERNPDGLQDPCVIGRGSEQRDVRMYLGR
jgi:hypothetical protein